MKKVLSSVVAALVALSFAGIVCAAEPAPASMPAGHPPVGAPADVKKEEKAAKCNVSPPARRRNPFHPMNAWGTIQDNS